jgi:hypothetical protein
LPVKCMKLAIVEVWPGRELNLGPPGDRRSCGEAFGVAMRDEDFLDFNLYILGKIIC